MSHSTGVVIEWTSPFTSIYIPKGGQVAGLELVDIQPSVEGCRSVPAGPTV